MLYSTRVLCGLATSALFLFTLSSPSYSAIPEGYQWLIDHQEPSGFVTSSDAITSEDFATLETIKSFSLNGSAAGFDMSLAKSALASSSFVNMELCAKFIELGIQVPMLENIGECLDKTQNIDGGAGDYSQGDSTTFDTVWLLQAMKISDPQSSEAIAAVAYLLGQQNSDGSWSYSSLDPSVYLTSLVVQTIYSYRTSLEGVQDSLNAALQYLLLERSLDGGWNDSVSSAAAITAIALVDPELVELQTSIEHIKSKQQEDGSWDRDVYTTALSIQAIKLVETISGSSSGAYGSVSGALQINGTNDVLAFADISIVGMPGFEATTNEYGRFWLSSLPAGTYTLKVTKDGYETFFIDVSVTEGIERQLGSYIVHTAGSIDLRANSNFKARFIDSVSKHPVEGVVVDGAEVATKISNASGDVVFAGIDLSNIDLTASAQGYVGATLSYSETGHGDFFVNIELVPEGVAGLTSSSFSGVVTDDSGIPLEAVVVEVPAQNLSVLTNTNGEYSLEGVLSLNPEIRVHLANFLTQDVAPSLRHHGSYVLDFSLDTVRAEDSFSVIAIAPPIDSIVANQTALFMTSIENLAAQTADVIVQGEVRNSSGGVVLRLNPYAVGTEVTTSLIDFDANETLDLVIPWEQH